MQLSVKKRGQPANDVRFKTGPIYIGRQVGSQVFLPDKSVSRQHSVIYQDSVNNWLIEDLGSTNKTYVNNQAVHKQILKDNDLINVGDFLIRLTLKDIEENPLSPAQQPRPIHLDDTVAGMNTGIQQIVRQPGAKQAPPITMPPNRAKDIPHALKSILKTTSAGELHRQLIDLLLHQFSAHDAWAALSTDPLGVMAIEGGRQISSQKIEKDSLAMPIKISYAMEKQKYLLIPQLPQRLQTNRTRSLMIAPILQGRNCLGVLYASNTAEHEPYTLADLDYLMIISMICESQLERF